MANTTDTQKDFIGRFQDLGEEALQKLAEVPGGSRIADFVNQTKARLDDLQKRVRGLEGLDKRVAKLEQEVAALKKSRSTTGSSSPASKPATTPKTPPA